MAHKKGVGSSKNGRESATVSVWLLSVVQVRVCVPLPLEVHSPQL